MNNRARQKALEKIKDYFGIDAVGIGYLAEMFAEDMDTVYQWRNGAVPSEKHAKRLQDLLKAIKILVINQIVYKGFTPNWDWDRPVNYGKSFFQLVGAGNLSAVEAAKSLVKVYKEGLKINAKLKESLKHKPDDYDSGEFTWQ